jgi:hypothetical protein
MRRFARIVWKMPLKMSNKKHLCLGLVSVIWLCGCTRAQPVVPVSEDAVKPAQVVKKIKNEARVIHVLVALCDNENQGIVPVPAFLGDGEDAQKNLYWGAAFGVKTFFSKSASWTKVAEIKDPKENVLQRIVFKHKLQNVYLVADAYRGSRMKETIGDFFAAVSGAKLENAAAGQTTLQILGSADLVAFVGHNGLMDFKPASDPVKKDDDPRDAIILACASRQYFAEALKKTSAAPLLWTSNLMAPEAYILHDALEGWVRRETAQQIQTRAAAAYAKYQKISRKSAQKLLVTGW